MTKGRLALIGLVPALILLAGQLGACRVASRPEASSRTRLEVQATAICSKLDALLAEALAAAKLARDGAPEAVALGLPPVLARRLEGAATLRAGRFESWSGTPAEAEFFGEPGSARVMSRGLRTSLLVRSEADAKGRSGVASFVLEIRAGPVSAEELLPKEAGGIVTRWDFATGGDAGVARFDAGPPATLRWPWHLVGSRPLAALVLEEPASHIRAARTRATALAFAALAFAIFVAAALSRRTAAVDAQRVAAIVSGAIASRAALAAGRTFETLLPRTLGSASLYGRGDAFGLLASPAALLATTLGAYFIFTVLARYAAGAAGRQRFVRPALATTTVILGCAAIVALAESLTRDARVRVPRLDPSSPGTLILALSAACLLAGVAECVAVLIGAARSASRRDNTVGRLAVAAALVPLSLLFLAQAYRVSERMMDDRLRADFAPLVLEQSARRRAALTAAVEESAAEAQVAKALAQTHGPDDAFLALDLWRASDLFHEGFASSIDLYDAEGNRRSHFGFAFPQVGGDREAVVRATTPGRPAIVEQETVPAGASVLHVVHAEAALSGPGGALLGRVVGHILEDPSNLPFLPGNAPYLDALGGGASPGTGPATEAPDYVLFDNEGRVAVSSVHQPPEATEALRAAASAGRLLDVSAGDVRYRVLPLIEGERLHVLMVPAPTILGSLADAVRLLLLGLAVVTAGAVAGLVHGRGAFGGLSALLDVVRGSFYRRLLATVLLASVIPLIGLSFFLRAYIERRGEASLTDAAAALVGAARRVVEDYLTVGEDDPTLPRLRINDDTLWWLRRVVGQEIHVYEGGVLAATSKPELFDSALLQARLPGEVDRDVVRGGLAFVVRRERLGTLPLPVAYALVDEPGGPRDAVIAVPLVIEQRAFTRSVDRLVEMLLLLTAALVMLLAVSAAWIARSVAQPVRRLADASRRIAGGNYGMRLVSSSRDEMGSLVADFNRMAAGLAAQRADIEGRRDYIEALLRHATTGVVSIDAAGRVVTINPAAEALLHAAGYPAQAGDALIAGLESRDALRPLAAALSGSPSGNAAPLEVDIRGAEGTTRFRVVRVPLPVPDGAAAGSLILLDDVTSLMKSNQLEAWAEMARAIAHEIKNPLTPIQLSAEHIRKLLLDRGQAAEPEIEACLATIVRNVKELRDISGAFSTYAKIPDLALQPIDPGSFLREIAAPYRAAPPPSVTIVLRHEETAPILADPRALGRAIVNLIENALQAMPDGGTLVIASGPGEPGEAVLSIEDTGTGLTPDARAHLFEPYFSTKSAGTGLGLAIVRRVVLGHNGSIDVTSEQGRGTAFRIRLRVILRA